MPNSSFKPLPLKRQTIVITGATSEIGLATARLAAGRGASVVIAARNGSELQKSANEMTARGWKVLPVVADVSKIEDLTRIRDEALTAFGKIDTWINNAGVSLYGYLMESDPVEERSLFEINFWGTRMGSSIAVEVMREKGGTLINMGSEASSAAQPLLGIYSASKHAVKGFTDALRVELKDRSIPVEVCLVRPTVIESPKASLPSPVYDPDVAAEAILKCAVTPQRDVYVGGPARLSAILDTFFPKVKDIVSESRMKELRMGTGKDKVRSAGERKTKKRSHYTDLTTMDVLKSVGGALRQLKKTTQH